VYGKNLFDKTYIGAANFGIAGVGATRLVNFNPPRTFGVTVKYDF